MGTEFPTALVQGSKPVSHYFRLIFRAALDLRSLQRSRCANRKRNLILARSYRRRAARPRPTPHTRFHPANVNANSWIAFDPASRMRQPLSTTGLELRNIQFVEYSITSVTRAWRAEADNKYSFCATHSSRISFWTVPEIRDQSAFCCSATAGHIRRNHGAGESMVIDTVTSPSGMPLKRISISSSEKDGHAALADFTG